MRNSLIRVALFVYAPVLSFSLTMTFLSGVADTTWTVVVASPSREDGASSSPSSSSSFGRRHRHLACFRRGGRRRRGSRPRDGAKGADEMAE
jgi:hypothetical protein